MRCGWWTRGQAYDAGTDGAMASVSPIELDELRDIVARAAVHGALDVANLNSPTQHVIAGERAAVDAALSILEEEQFVQGVVIEQRIPMHSSRFAPVADAFRPALERTPWRTPRRPYLPNVYARPVEAASAADLIEALSLHVYSPVRWRASLELLAERYADAIFVEVGPRAVLHNLLNRRWLPNRKQKTDSSGDLHTHFAALVEDLADAA
jgi:[acyl-carrier-protein] S-malonyltransferase